MGIYRAIKELSCSVQHKQFLDYFHMLKKQKCPHTCDYLKEVDRFIFLEIEELEEYNTSRTEVLSMIKK